MSWDLIDTLTRRSIVLEDHDGTHMYLVDGAPAPSVSHIMREEGLIDYEGVAQYRLDNAAERGEAVHLAISDMLTGRPDWWSATDHAGYVRAAWAWVSAAEQTYLASDLPVYNPKLCYAGTLDGLFLDVEGVSGISAELTVVDWKATHDVNPWSAVSTAGYALAVNEMLGGEARCQRAVVVHLSKDGSFREIPCQSIHAETFTAACRLYHWKRANLRTYRSKP